MFLCMYFYELNKCRHVNDKTTENVIVFNEMYFLFQTFRRVLIVVRFLLGNYAASEFYVPTFQSTLSVPSS